MVRGDGLRDHPAHRDADQVRVGIAERIHQADGVTRHVTEVVLVPGVAATEHRHRIRRPIRHVGRPADVAIVESRHAIAAPGECADEIFRPRMQLLPQTGDEHDRRIVRVAGLVVAQFDTATHVDDRLARGHAETRAASLGADCAAPARRRYTTALPPRRGAVATPRE